MTMKKSFELKDWVDYVRGVAPPETAARMDGELAATPPGSVPGHEMAKSLQKGLQWRREMDVPADVLRRAEALLATATAGRVAPPFMLPATLTFDSFAGPRLAGVRSVGAAARQTTHRAGEYQIAMRWERPAHGGLSIVGQVSADAGNNLGGFVVVAMRRDRTVGRTQGSGSGEFQLDIARPGATRLIVEMAEPPRRIEVALLEGNLEPGS